MSLTKLLCSRSRSISCRSWVLLLFLAGQGGCFTRSPTAPKPKSPKERTETTTLGVAHPGLMPDGRPRPCQLVATVDAWPRGDLAPRGRAIYSGWIDGRYVHVEDHGEKGMLRAAVYTPGADRWTESSFDPFPGPIRQRLTAAKARLRPGSSYSSLDFVATQTRLVLAPGYSHPAAYAGAVFDPRALSWHPITRGDARWLKSPSRFISGREALLFWPKRATPHTRAGSEILLFYPETGRWQTLPPPPVKLDRESALVIFDDQHLLFWGGFLEDLWGKPKKLLGDGAIYDLATQRWQALRGYSPSVAPTALLHQGWLLLFGGTDPLRALQQRGVPWHLKDHVVQDYALLEIRQQRWSRPPLRWEAWHYQPGLLPCTGCPPRVRVGNRLFFNHTLVYDGDTHQLRQARQIAAPPSWQLKAQDQPERLAGHALDDRHALVLSLSSATAAREAIVLDTTSLQWCSLQLPDRFAEALLGARLSVREQTLYLWQDAREVIEERPYNCPPGAPCKAPDRVTHHLPAEALIVQLAARTN